MTAANDNAPPAPRARHVGGMTLTADDEVILTDAAAYRLELLAQVARPLTYEQFAAEQRELLNATPAPVR